MDKSLSIFGASLQSEINFQAIFLLAPHPPDEQKTNACKTVESEVKLQKYVIFILILFPQSSDLFSEVNLLLVRKFV